MSAGGRVTRRRFVSGAGWTTALAGTATLSGGCGAVPSPMRVPRSFGLASPRLGGSVSFEEVLTDGRSRREFAGRALTEQEISQLLWAAPVTVGLFLRELRGVRPEIDPPLDARARQAAEHLGLLARNGGAGACQLRDVAGEAGASTCATWRRRLYDYRSLATTTLPSVPAGRDVLPCGLRARENSRYNNARAPSGRDPRPAQVYASVSPARDRLRVVGDQRPARALRVRWGRRHEASPLISPRPTRSASAQARRQLL